MKMKNRTEDQNNRPKRKYTRRKEVTTTVKTQRIPLHGIQLTLSDDFVKKVTIEQQEQTEKEFRESVLRKFQKWIQDTTESLDVIDESEMSQLPQTVGESSAGYSRELSREFVFLPQGDYSLRCHVGLMTLMEWTGKEILRREKELARLKSMIPESSLLCDSPKEGGVI
jgi:hypothetical protein